MDNMKLYTEKKPDDGEGFYLLGKSYQSLKKYPEAIAAFDKAVELNKSDVNAYSALGVIYQNQENYAQALNMFQKVVSLKADNYQAHYNLAIAYEQLNPDKTDSVIGYWSKFLKVAKNNPRAQRLIPQAEEHLKELQAAKGNK